MGDVKTQDKTSSDMFNTSVYRNIKGKLQRTVIKRKFPKVQVVLSPDNYKYWKLIMQITR